MTYYHFCYVLLITRPTASAIWERTTQKCKYQEAGVLGALLEAGYLKHPVFNSTGEYFKSKNILIYIYLFIDI